ncbi:MAG: metallophosphoesterase [Chloroflexales bacterium]|nr:metallophosphoesterase [Chloroflexales bacterium]
MQVLSISDEVVPTIYSLNVKQRFDNVQLVLSCGDLPIYYLEFVVTMLGIPCLYVHGNHDGPEETSTGQIIIEPRGCISLEDRSVFHDGLILAGLGGSIRYNHQSNDQYTEQEMTIRVLRLTPRLFFNRLRYGRYLDVLLTHAPPLHIHNGPDYPHRGFQTFLRFMDRFEPRYLIHGHIHLSYGFGSKRRTRYHKTLVVNTAGYRLLEIDPAAAHSGYTAKIYRA